MGANQRGEAHGNVVKISEGVVSSVVVERAVLEGGGGESIGGGLESRGEPGAGIGERAVEVRDERRGVAREERHRGGIIRAVDGAQIDEFGDVEDASVAKGGGARASRVTVAPELVCRRARATEHHEHAARERVFGGGGCTRRHRRRHTRAGGGGTGGRCPARGEGTRRARGATRRRRDRRGAAPRGDRSGARRRRRREGSAAAAASSWGRKGTHGGADARVGAGATPPSSPDAFARADRYDPRVPSGSDHDNTTAAGENPARGGLRALEIQWYARAKRRRRVRDFARQLRHSRAREYGRARRPRGSEPGRSPRRPR